MAEVVWTLWKTRNDLVFSKKNLKNPKQVAYKAFGLLKQWQILVRKEDLKMMEHGGNAEEDEGRPLRLVKCA
jgi:hypothetical protein